VASPLTRAPILWLAERGWVRRLVTQSAIGRRVALRFVAGESVDEGLRAALLLGDDGIAAMLDYLGENVERAEQASAAADAYVLALKRIEEGALANVNISIKLTQLGLDVSNEICLENSRRVLEAAETSGTLVMIDMEAAEYVDRTLGCFRTLRERFPMIGVCVQAYLRRSANDVRRLAEEGATVRICKGAYLEPPDIAFPRRREVNRSFRELAATLLVSGSAVHVATHDPRLIEGAKRFIERRGISPQRVEFQMLYGIRRDLQERLAREGYLVRVYVPYGAQWYPYLSRRLAERPANLWFLVSNLARRRG
jgi:proline dehydrogenase